MARASETRAEAKPGGGGTGGRLFGVGRGKFVVAAVGVVAGGCAIAGIALLATRPAAISCTSYAAPGGNDGNDGTKDRPYATAQRLADGLAPGAVGCLRAGTYRENVKMRKAGSPASAAVLASAPGETATLVGRLWVALGADHVTVTGIRLNGKNPGTLPSPTINASHAKLLNNDITNENTEICVMLGSDWGRADFATVQGNRIHDCGRVAPVTNMDHGIYVAAATGARISYNLIYRNADRGIQLYPDADGTAIDHNVIDGNGEGIIFSGLAGAVSDGNTVEHNLITNSGVRYNVESYYDAGSPVGQGNIVRNNCIYGGIKGSGNGGIKTPQIGFTVDGSNLAVDPGYSDRASGDFHLTEGSCLSLTGDIQSAIEGGGIHPPLDRPRRPDAEHRPRICR